MRIAPWHEFCTLRDDVASGRMSLDEFAADLDSVRKGTAPPVYQNAADFFVRTYPTRAMQDLVRQVLRRLAGLDGAPILNLQVAYGGGKTHTLISLLHLAEQGKNRMDNETVRTFVAFAGLPEPPHARVALLPGDKMDVLNGYEAVSPNGSRKVCKTPWGILAYQLGGDAGFAKVMAHEEQWTPPAQNTMESLLQMAIGDVGSVLILIDEAVYHATGVVLQDRGRIDALRNFYQALTQAVAATNRCALVATLVDSGTMSNSTDGIETLKMLEQVFGRMHLTSQPVGKEDIAEVLRRRLFESYPTADERKTFATAQLAAYQSSDKLSDSQKNQAAHDRLSAAYPFHPDLLDIFFTKWAQLSNFQRTRGALRILSEALRVSNGNDRSAWVGLGAFLNPDGGLSPVLQEMIKIVNTSGGNNSDRWTPVLLKELDHAQNAQSDLATLGQREIEQAVIGVFMHSQSSPKWATQSDLYALLLHADGDSAALETGLGKWRDLSWYLTDDKNIWQMGIEPNLTHMHAEALATVSPKAISDELNRQIEKTNSLFDTNRNGEDREVVVSKLPKSPTDIADEPTLQYLVLGVEYACDLGTRSIPASAKAFFERRTTSRAYKNALIALAPRRDGVDTLHQRVRALLGWDVLAKSEVAKKEGFTYKPQIEENKRRLESELPGAIISAYNLVLDVDQNGQVRLQELKASGLQRSGVQAFGSDGSAWSRIKAMLDAEQRLLIAPQDPEALTKTGPNQLWRPDQTHQNAEVLFKAFAQYPRLPRFLSRRIYRESLSRAAEAGTLVLRLPRLDGTGQTFWFSIPPEEVLTQTDLEVWVAGEATLETMEPDLLKFGILPNLWANDGTALPVSHLKAYFGNSGRPQVSDDLLRQTVKQAVQRGIVQIRDVTRAFYNELFPDDMEIESAELTQPPTPIAAKELFPESLPVAWHNGEATVAEIAKTFAEKQGAPVAQSVLYQAIKEAVSSAHLKVKEGIWSPYSSTAMQTVLMTTTPTQPTPVSPPPIQPALLPPLSVEAKLSIAKLSLLVEQLTKLQELAPSQTFTYQISIVSEGSPVSEEQKEKMNVFLGAIDANLRFM